VALPTVLARASKVQIPPQVELVLLVVVLTDVTLGKLLSLYERLSWFDKGLHLGNSMLIALLGFLFIYVLQVSQRMTIPVWMSGALIIMVTVGIGGIWEIVEYASDRLFDDLAQGSPLMNPLQDTMWDLILDLIGGTLGASIAGFYISHSNREQRARLQRFAFFGRGRARGEAYRSVS
jgi:hypothetical protein